MASWESWRFFRFEHYPVDPGKVQWSSLYDEAYLVQHIMDVWREDGVPANVPFFITESNLSSASSEAYMEYLGRAVAGRLYRRVSERRRGSAVYLCSLHAGTDRPWAQWLSERFNIFSATGISRSMQPLSQTS